MVMMNGVVPSMSAIVPNMTGVVPRISMARVIATVSIVAAVIRPAIVRIAISDIGPAAVIVRFFVGTVVIVGVVGAVVVVAAVIGRCA